MNHVIDPRTLGAQSFRQRYRLRFAYVAGSMYKGIASKEMVIRMGKAGLLGFLGTGGMRPDRIESDLLHIQSELGGRYSYGLNFLASPFNPELECATTDLLLTYAVPCIEASAFTQMSSNLVRLRVSGLEPGPDGQVRSPRRILAKASRPEIAEQFLSPAPRPVLTRLIAQGAITQREAELAAEIPMADDLCVEADSGGHTDQGVASTLLPVMLKMRDELSARYRYNSPISVGLAGGLGAPEAVAAALTMGADFVLTGSINQCSVESGTSDTVKDMLQTANVQDTDIVPAGDMFEIGAKVQVFKKGLLFPGRAKKLYELYRQYDAIEEIDPKTREQIEQRYFGRSFEAVYAETRDYYQRTLPAMIESAERNPKRKMALIFRWYFVHSSRLALRGSETQKSDYQIHCGPALGAFNAWVKGTSMEPWRNRHVDAMAEMLMASAAQILDQRYRQMLSGPVLTDPSSSWKSSSITASANSHEGKQARHL
jgi:trans-AT polyketide synthase/acyltransferase/oxidoreductase domain-containing protein